MHGCYTCMQVIINFIVATCTCTFMLEGKRTMTCTAARGGGHSASYYFIQARPGFEANGVEVQLHVDVRMRQKAGTQTTKIKSAKSFVEFHPRKFIPSKYTRYTVHVFHIDNLPLYSLLSQVFVELEELHVRSDVSDELEWEETARWIKFEEDVEEGSGRWGRPHVSALAFHSLVELRRGLEKGGAI